MTKPFAVNIVIGQPPISNIEAKEAVDLALACAAFEQKVNLLFIDEGIFHLLKGQNQLFHDDKLHDRLLSALKFYDIQNIYAAKACLKRYALSEARLIDGVTLLSKHDIQAMLEQNQTTLIF